MAGFNVVILLLDRNYGYISKQLQPEQYPFYVTQPNPHFFILLQLGHKCSCLQPDQLLLQPFIQYSARRLTAV